ncbi:MAG: hypothetical protein KJ626_14810 [Verrucomicrobia bacterium]|nr:hypothetical protein [Verrucomicrobiota bacterium]
MKVKIGALKTNLSRYVQDLREGGEPIEVCVREKTVAYLSAAPIAQASAEAEARALDAELAGSGLRLERRGGELPRGIVPGRAGDGRSDIDSVQQIRSEKDW